MRAHAKERNSGFPSILRTMRICACLLFLNTGALLAGPFANAMATDPAIAEIENTLDRLIALVKGGGSRSDVEAVHTDLRKVTRRLKEEKGFKGIATKYEKRAEYLWAEYARGLGKVRDVCPGCPVLDLATLAKGFDRPRLVGAGDYTLEDLAEMEEDTKTEKPAYKTLITGDFNQDSIMDVALIGRGSQKAKSRLFLLIASVEPNSYRRLFLLPLEWNRAALAAKEGKLILSMIFGPTDDFWTLRWTGKTFVLRYAGEEMSHTP